MSVPHERPSLRFYSELLVYRLAGIAIPIEERVVLFAVFKVILVRRCSGAGISLAAGCLLSALLVTHDPLTSGNFYLLDFPVALP